MKRKIEVTYSAKFTKVIEYDVRIEDPYDLIADIDPGVDGNYVPNSFEVKKLFRVEENNGQDVS